MLKRIFTGLYHFGWYAIAFIVLNAAVLVTVVRLALPEIGSYKDEIQSWVSEYMDYPVVIDNISAEWQGWTPNLYLQNIDLYTQDNSSIITEFESAHLGIDLIASLSEREIIPNYLSVSGLDFEVSRHSDGSVSINSNGDNTGNSSALSGWLLKQKHIILENASVTWHDEKSPNNSKKFSNVHLELKTDKQRVQLSANITLPEQYGQSLSFKMDVNGNVLTPDWSGSIYVEAAAFNPTDLLDELPVNSIDGSANFKLWTSWNNAKLTDFNGEIDFSDFSLHAGEYKLPVNNVSITIIGERKHDRDWLLNVKLDDLQTSHGLWPPSNYQLNIEEDDSGNKYRYSGYLSYLKLEEVLPFILASGTIPEELLQTLDWQSIKGELTDLNVIIAPNARTTKVIHFDSTFENLDIATHDNSHSASGLEGRLTAHDDHIKILLNSEFPKINIGSLYDKPYSLSEINADIDLLKNDSVELSINKLDMVSDDISINSSGKIRLDEHAPFIDMVAHLNQTSIESIPTYLPRQTSQTLSTWFNSALLGGQILSGDFIYHGYLTDYPFNNSEGHFKAIISIDDTTLDYSDNWPAVDNLTAEIVIDNDDLTISSHSGYIFDAKINNLSAEIKDLSQGDHYLSLNGSINGHTSDTTHFILQSPLNKKPSLNELTNKIAGAFDLELELGIPLGKDKTSVAGLISFTDTTIISTLPGLGLENVNGDVNFTNDQVWANNIGALYHGKPVKLTIPKIDKLGIGSQLFEISGLADKTFILNQLTSFFPSLYSMSDIISKHFTGESEWLLSLKTTITNDKKSSRDVELSSDLNGIAINLPHPFGKDKQETRPLNIKTSLIDSSINKIEFNYDNTIFTDIIIDNSQNVMLKQLLVGLGQPHPATPLSADISVQGELEQLDLSEWLNLIDIGKLAPSQAKASQQSKNIVGDFNVRELKIIDNTFNAVNISLSNPLEGWKFSFDGADIKGHTQFIKAYNNKNDRLLVNLEKLTLQGTVDETGDEKVASQTDIKKIPELDINIDKFTYNNNELGRLNLLSNNITEGINIKNLSLTKPGFSIKAKGEWLRIDNIDRSDFHAKLDADSVETMLSAFDYNTANIKDGKTSIEMKANWMDTPMNFSMAKINGELDMQIDKGQFLDIDPSAGRLFGLLSLQTLPRRLALDFTDLFNKGFSFDSIEGNFSMEDGHAYTNNLELKGPAANIMVSGRTGFITEDYDQVATITPKVSNSLPVASALFGPIGVGVGAVIYLTGELFKSLPNKIDDILRYQYSIKGSWDNPDIEKIKKDRKSG